MLIKRVHYSALLNLGNYRNERIGFVAAIEPDESIEEVVETLRDKVKLVGGENADKLYTQIHDARIELREIESKIEKAREQWSATAAFLRAQGLRPDAPDMPNFTNFLPGFEESVEISEGELEEEDEEEEDEN